MGWAAREVVTDEAAEVAMEEAALRARPAHRSGGGPPRAAQETKLSARPRLDGREGGAQQGERRWDEATRPVVVALAAAAATRRRCWGGREGEGVGDS